MSHSTSRPARTPQRVDGFTLLELVFVVGMTGILISLVASIFMNITTDTNRAADRVREVRSAAAVLDRIASDVESAYLIRKEPEADPLVHPWVFIADSQLAQSGADRLMFTTVAHRSDAIAINRAQRKGAAGLATYAYLLEPDPEALREGSFRLSRWINPFLAEEHSFPRADDPALMPVAENVASFALRFQDEAGGWVDSWDSTLIAESGELPIAVEIRLGLWPDLDEQELELLEESGEPLIPVEYRRSVVLYQRPMMSDSEAAFIAGGGVDGEENPNKCIMTFAQCLDLLKPSLPPETWSRLYNTNCVEKGNEQLFDTFGNQVNLSQCGRSQ